MSRRPLRNSNTSLLLVTNGEITERAYLGALKQLCRGDHTLSIKVHPVSGDPMSVLTTLASPRGDTRSYDEIWIIVDEDGVDRERFLAECRRRCTPRQRWVGVVSRPCFEVWLAAHYAQVRAYQDQSQAQRHYYELTGLTSGSKQLPEPFPHDQRDKASSRCRLHGVPLEECGQMPPSPGSGMPHLLARLGLLDL